jgi:hypothetical protein
MLSLTDFADQAVILPVVVLTAVALMAAGWRRAALALHRRNPLLPPRRQVPLFMSP